MSGSGGRGAGRGGGGGWHRRNLRRMNTKQYFNHKRTQRLASNTKIEDEGFTDWEKSRLTIGIKSQNMPMDDGFGRDVDDIEVQLPD